MVEVSVAKLRSSLASILQLVQAGETVLVRRHGRTVAVLSTARSRRRLPGQPSKAATAWETGPVVPVRLRRRPKRAPSDELIEEAD